MQIWMKPVKKTKVRCEKCGENFYNQQVSVGQPCNEFDLENRKEIKNPNKWKNRRWRSWGSNTAYLCNDCVAESFELLAKDALEFIKKLNFKKVLNIEHITKLAQLKHERQIVTKIRKEKKTEQLQIKRKERNTGLNVIGII